MHPESSNYADLSTTNLPNYTMTTYVPANAAQGNRIYVNKNLVPTIKNLVHVNPNFTRQVHVNPNFAKANQVFVNPNVFKKIGPRSDNQGNLLKLQTVCEQKSEQVQPPVAKDCHQLTQPIVSKYSKINNPNLTSSRIARTKFGLENRLNAMSCSKSQYSINNLAKTTNTVKISTSNALVKTKTKLILVQTNDKRINASFKPKAIITRHKLIRNENSVKSIIKSKYKLVRSNAASKTPMRMKQQLSRLSNALLNTPNRFKLDNRTSSCTIIRSRYKLTKKAYMMRLNPQNSIIKNTKFKLIRSTKLKKVDTERKVTLPRNTIQSTIKQKRKLIKKKYTKPNLVKINKKKLQKNNIPCESYNRRGVCKGFASGKCSKKHDPNQIQICIWFLQGICRDEKCTLSHKASPEKMPTCKFFLEGICHKDKCPYLHVKLSKDAAVCRDFLNGYCAKALECDKRHQFLCPDFERDGKCSRKLCRYPHGKAVRQYKDTLLNVIARNRKSKPRKSSAPIQKGKLPNRKPSAEMHAERRDAATAEVDNKRYYDCHSNVANDSETSEVAVEDAVNVFDRPKLGSLPSFISL